MSGTRNISLAFILMLGAGASAQDATEPMRSAPWPDAVVLFDGADTKAWQHRDGGDLKWRIDNENGLVIDPGSGPALTRQTFGDFTLHLEFMCPPDELDDQSSGNSGVYIYDSYEVQILNPLGAARQNGCGAIYRFKAPDVDATRPPGQWQSFDIEFVAPRWSEAGEKRSDARITVRHNGALIHNDVRVTRKTGQGAPERPGGGPIVLQDHGNRVRFRNIWIIAHPTWEGPQADGFTPLFNGMNLDGWRQLGGKANYKMVDGVIVGETRPNQSNSFLCTGRNFDNFVLELEFAVDRELNSGIQIRSNSTPEYRDGRVHGYQVEIDPSHRSWTAGVYDESRRGWLANLENNPRAQKAFRQDDWNRLRIVARGDVIRTYLNDVPAALLVDDMTASGFIGLQVHGVGDRLDPLNVRWRDIRLRKLE